MNDRKNILNFQERGDSNEDDKTRVLSGPGADDVVFSGGAGGGRTVGQPGKGIS